MKELLTAQEMRAREVAVEASGRTLASLMDQAGAAVAQAALGVASPSSRFFVVCGPGNNGGDGFVAARWLLERGRQVCVEAVGPESAPGIAREARQRLMSAGGKLGASELGKAKAGDVVVDALFGTGLTRAPEGPFAEAVQRVRQARANGARVVAADLPSGLQSDTGQAFTPHVEADLTVALGALKIAHASEPAFSFCGDVALADLGLAASPKARAWQVEAADVRAMLPPRAPTSNKGTYGHVLVVAGSPGKTGAAAMVALGALRAGAGLATVATGPDSLGQVLSHAPELMGVVVGSNGALESSDFDALKPLLARKQALVVGPGLARGPHTPDFLEALLAELEQPCVLDADALNALAERPALLRRAKAPVILTPHPGEMGRLTGQSVAEVQAQRVELARRFASTHGVTVVLKGARTIVALADGSIRLNSSGNPGMATGGAGDVLSGILGGLLAQGLSPEDAATAAVYVHGRAGDLGIRHRGMKGLMATDLLDGLGEVWAEWRL